MLYAWIGHEKGEPIAKRGSTACRDCGGLLNTVMSAKKGIGRGG